MQTLEQREQTIVREASELLKQVVGANAFYAQSIRYSDTANLAKAKNAAEAQGPLVTAFLERHGAGADRLEADHPLVTIVQKMRSELETLDSTEVEVSARA